MANLTSTLTVKLLDQVSGPAGAASRALLGLGAAVSAANMRVNFGGIAGMGAALNPATSAISRINAGLAAMGARLAAASVRMQELASRMSRMSSSMSGVTFPLGIGAVLGFQQTLSFDRVGNMI
jgi:hypothetical protein